MIMMSCRAAHQSPYFVVDSGFSAFELPAGVEMPVELPTDVFKIIIGFLDLRDVHTLRLVCREFHELTQSRALWKSLLRRYVLSQPLPIPRLYGKDLDLLSPQDLEQCLRRALRLRRNWVAPLPAVVKRFVLPALSSTRIVSMHVVPCFEKSLLLALSMRGATRQFMLRCWDVDRQPPVCLAAHDCSQFRGLAVNKSSRDGTNIVAVLDPHLHILSLKSPADATDGPPKFFEGQVFPDERNIIQIFSGSTVISRENNGTMHLWDLSAPDLKTQIQSPHQMSPPLDVVLTDDYILLLRSTHLEFYALPTAKGPPPNSPLRPLFVYQWQWRIDNAGMSIRRPVTGSTLRSPINILIRYGSYFPWAINILHHYELPPNHTFLSDAPLTPGNLPYEFPPVLRETIGSPVRLHATSDMALGEYGTALWTDSHTEDFYGHADRGQRVAGRFSRRYTPLLPRGFGLLRGIDRALGELGDGDGGGDGDGEEDEGEDVSDQVASAVATSVYTHQEEDTWVRLALDEREGRIFLGRDDGFIEVLEYL